MFDWKKRESLLSKVLTRKHTFIPWNKAVQRTVVINPFCPFVLLSKTVICSYVIMSNPQFFCPIRPIRLICQIRSEKSIDFLAYFKKKYYFCSALMEKTAAKPLAHRRISAARSSNHSSVLYTKKNLISREQINEICKNVFEIDLIICAV